VMLGRVAGKMLRQLGYEPFVFDEPEAAWQAIREKPAAYDILISDLTMPVMTGLELARRVSGLRPDLPIVLSSGTVGALTGPELQEAGIGHMLLKPLNYKNLALAVHQMLPGPAHSK
jgi:CheY-like chemotaxis protein